MWLAAAVGATVVLAILAMSLPNSLGWLSLLVGTLASLPMLAWFLALRRWTHFAEGWPDFRWHASALLAYVIIGIAYAGVRWGVTGSVGAYTVPLMWPALLVIDAGCALDAWTCAFG